MSQGLSPYMHDSVCRHTVQSYLCLRRYSSKFQLMFEVLTVYNIFTIFPYKFWVAISHLMILNVEKYSQRQLLTFGHIMYFSRGAGTYGDIGTCPNHILGQSLENVLFWNIVHTKLKTKLVLSSVSLNTFRRHCFPFLNFHLFFKTIWKEMIPHLKALKQSFQNQV